MNPVKPSVAICIPTYNQAPYLAQSVRSACLQTYAQTEGATLEIWLSDDASTDETPAVVAQLQAEFPHVRATRQTNNLGMSGNPRWVISQPQTDYLVKLDSDDELYPDYVSALVERLEAHPRAGYGHCAVEQIDDDGDVTRVRRLRRASGFESADDALRASVQGYRVAANICIFRRAALEEVDFYKTDMAFCDDWDLSVRLADAGWGNVYDERVLAKYRVWTDAGGVRPRRKLDEVEGNLRVFGEALAPAFKRRGWDEAPLLQSRRAMALSHGSVLDSPLFSARERRQLQTLLRKLGGSSRLRVQSALLRCGLGPLVRGGRASVTMAKDVAKRALAKRRG